MEMPKVGDVVAADYSSVAGAYVIKVADGYRVITPVREVGFSFFTQDFDEALIFMRNVFGRRSLALR